MRNKNTNYMAQQWHKSP